MPADDTRELFLIDGNSLVYRAFFALPETIATSKGQPTNAIFGFASMLVKILTEYGPKSTVVVWDAGMSGREEVSADYKAQRKARPDLLQEQWPHMQPLVEAFGYRNVKVPGYEADDVIATLAKRAREQGIDVMIVTGDRDAFQLIEPPENGRGEVKVMATSRGITETKVYDREAVIDRYGIGPELIPDFYGLKGDTSDNIPGVPGIGDKTASELLQRFGSLEKVLDSVDEISGAKRKENLTNHAEDARISKRLATAVQDVELDIDLEECLADEPDRARLREVFREFELRAPLERLEEALGEDAAAPRETAAVTVEARAVPVPPSAVADLEGSLATLVAERPQPDDGAVLDRGPSGAPGQDSATGTPLGELALDVDAASTQPPLTFAAYAGGAEVLTGEAETLAAIAMAWGDRPVVAHDWKTLAASEEPCDAPPLEHDTLVAAYLLDPAGRAYPLDELADREGLGASIEGGDGLAERAVVTRTLAERQRAELEKEGLTRLFEEVELPLVDVLVDLQRAGVKLDTAKLAEISTKVQEQVEQLEREIHELAGEPFTIGSPQQLGEILFNKLGLSKKRRGKTGFSTDARVLQAIRAEHEIVPKVERWRELSKLKSTYLDALPLLVDRRSRLHTTFNQTATTTGRLSSTDPNLQNIPIRTELGREIRACFVAEEGHRLISVDYSQVELRVLAHVCGEQVLKDIFARGEDVHTATAAEMFGVKPEDIDPGTRSKAKMINFGIVYGLSAYGLADRLDIPQDEAGEFIARYLDRFPKVRQYIDETIAEATESGYVTTIFGRKRRIPELRSRKWQTRSLGERLAVNTPIQGSAADIIKVAMVRCANALRDAGLATRLVLQIHDELLFEAPAAEVEAASEIVVREMAGAYDLDPPLAVDVGSGENWLAAK
ncbi:MAG: DNA polymerase I [Actinomycetota bacterium]|nr:DNA polymerase I [Actinomycetota bacterium]